MVLEKFDMEVETVPCMENNNVNRSGVAPRQGSRVQIIRKTR